MNEQTTLILRNKAMLPSATGVAGLGVGLVIGYFISRRKQKMLIEELVNAKAEYDSDMRVMSETLARALDNDPRTPEIMEKIVEDALDEEEDDVPEPHHGDVVNPRRDPAEIKIVKPARSTRNIFPMEPVAEFDYEKERSRRTLDEPYVISREEFEGDEMGFNQDTLTYYEGDDVICDTQDVPLYDYSQKIGELKFGYGSDDPNVVYIRNERLGMEWEIIKDSGHYAVEVLGHEIEDQIAREELKHSRRPGKFRPE